jgi:hypothetical protein
MTNCCPIASFIFGCNRRNEMSLFPPGEAGLITRMGFVGKACPEPVEGAMPPETATATIAACNINLR